MVTTLVIPATLPRTLDDVRTRIRAELGTVGIPNLHWPLATGQDCLGFLTWAAGIRERDDLTNALISIRGFRGSSGWHEVGPAEVRPGDWPLWDWDGDGEPDHATFAYSVDRAGNELTTDEANTGPRVGVDIDLHPELRGVYQKTRPLDSPNLWGALRPQYAAAVTTSADRKAVRTAGSWLNRHIPATLHDDVTGRTLTLHRTEAGDIGSAKGDGKRGPLYRLLVQAYGATHDEHGRTVKTRSAAMYGPTYKLDTVFGRRSEYVEGRLFTMLRVAS